jgi:deoxyhypusine synthase
MLTTFFDSPTIHSSRSTNKTLSYGNTLAKKQSKFLSGRRIDPSPITRSTKLVDLVDNTFVAYNAARLREACWLFTRKMLEPDVTVGITLTGALTPAGLGMSALIPLIKAGFIDWIISTGANFYHDTHFGMGLAMHEGNASTSDIVLRDEEVVRIYDIFFDYSVLLNTDDFFRRVIEADEFQKPMSTSEFHYRVGRYVLERERKLGLKNKSLLAAAHEHAVPLYTSSPGDSSIGMNVAAKALQGNKLAFDPSLDVNETAAIVLAAKRGLIRDGGDPRAGGIVSASARGPRLKEGGKMPANRRQNAGAPGSGKSAIFILGGGSPKNFALQTEPQIQEVLGIDERGHDYFLQITDARPDTGGLSGATPGEAVSWGKVDPDRLPDAVVCYLDSTVALPVIAAYALAQHKPRKPRRLYNRREEFMNLLLSEYRKSSRR